MTTIPDNPQDVMGKMMKALEGVIDEFDHRLPPLKRLEGDIFRGYLNAEIADMVDVLHLNLFALAAHNGKSIPALQLIIKKILSGELRPGMTVVMATSGNTGVGGAHLCRRLGLNLTVVVKTGTPEGKLQQLRLAARKIKLTILNPPPGKTTIEYAHELAQEPGCVEINQYTDEASVQAHKRWTVPHLYREADRLDIEPSLIVLPVGTTSLLVACEALKEWWPDLKIVGAACAEGEEIPGARTVKALGETGFGYQNVIDYPLVLMTLKESMEKSADLVGSGVSGGLTSGMGLAAACAFLNQQYAEGGMKALKPLMNAAGRIVLILIFMDMHLMYDYGDVLNEDLMSLRKMLSGR